MIRNTAETYVNYEEQVYAARQLVQYWEWRNKRRLARGQNPVEETAYHHYIRMLTKVGADYYLAEQEKVLTRCDTCGKDVLRSRGWVKEAKRKGKQVCCSECKKQRHGGWSGRKREAGTRPNTGWSPRFCTQPSGRSVDDQTNETA